MPTRPKPRPATMVVLVRHGLTPTTGKEMPEAGAGPELSDEGRQQAAAAAAYLCEWRPSLPPMAAIYCSPLHRTRQTAGALAEALRLELTTDSGLVDCNAGEWSGVALADLAKKPEWPTVVHHPSAFTFPGGEALADMSARAVATVRRLVDTHPGQTVVVVSHADPIKAVLTDALGLHLDLFQRVVIAPASVSAVSYSPEGTAVMLTNWTKPVPEGPGQSVPGADEDGHKTRSRR